MCVCNPKIRTPYCGKEGCQWPNSKPANARETPAVDNYKAIAAISLVSTLGDDMGLWLRKMRDEIQKEIDNGVQVCQSEITALMGRYKDDLKILNPGS